MFYYHESPIHGIGSFANVRIPRGTLIDYEAPFLRLCLNELPVPVDDPQDPRWPQWQTWLELRPPGTSLSELVQTTSLRCGTMRRNNQQMEAWGLFLRAARFNNSCQPNINAHWNDRAGRLELRALQDIAQNEELCHCYDPPTLLYSTAERRERLHTKFGFFCHCTACNRNTPGSDGRRTNLRRALEAGIPTPSDDADRDAQTLRNFINQRTRAIGLLRAADLYNYADTLHYDLYAAYNQARHTNNAMLCLVASRNLARAMVGNDDPRVVQMTAALPHDKREDYSPDCSHTCCQVAVNLVD